MGGQGLAGPRLVTADATTPAQGPLVIVQARSPTAIVWLVPSVIAAIRMALLRNITPLPRPSWFRQWMNLSPCGAWLKVEKLVGPARRVAEYETLSGHLRRPEPT